MLAPRCKIATIRKLAEAGQTERQHVRSAAQALAFYERNYVITGFWALEPGKRRIIIGDRQNRRCRFCGRYAPEAKFEMEAHAVPQALGNRALLTAHECDDCNQFFGRTIENDFGNWSKPIRTLAQIRGKSGKVPSMKGRSRADWRIDGTSGGLNVTHERDDTIMETDHERRRIIFRLPRDSYRPVAVLKTFVKMGLCLVPEGDLPYFKDTLEWVASIDHGNHLLSGHTVMMELLPGPSAGSGIGLVLFRRKDDYRKLPFYLLSVAYGAQVFQIVLPSKQKDWVMRGHEAKVPLFPHYSDKSVARFGAPQTFALDLTGREMVRGEIETVTFSYDEVTPVDPPASPSKP